MIGILVLILLVFIVPVFVRSDVKYSKKIIIVCVVILTLFILYGIIVFINHRVIKTYTIEETLGVNLDDISYVKIDNRNQYDSIIDDFKNEYKTLEFRKDKYIDEIVKEKFSESILTGMLHYTYICYDSNNNNVGTILVKGNGIYEINGETYYGK